MNPAGQTLWFGRDPLGRRSLLAHWPDAADGRLLLASASHADARPSYWQVGTDGSTSSILPYRNTEQITMTKAHPELCPCFSAAKLL